MVKLQKGIALVVALLVVALAGVLIAGLLDRGELSAARARNALRTAQAQAYAQGLESYAARTLAQSRQNDEFDSNASTWAVPMTPTKVPGGEFAATLSDRNGCFNLNDLNDGQFAPDWQRRFRRLLRALKLDERLTDNIVEWTSPKPMAGDIFYAQSDPPYRPAKRDFVHVSELRLVKGIDANVYAHLAPVVCALPRGTKININTATPAVLMSLSDSLDERAAKALWNEGHAAYATLPPQIAGLPELMVLCQQTNAPACPVDVHSSYFLARADVMLDALSFTWFSLIEYRRDGGGGPRVIERSRGADS